MLPISTPRLLVRRFTPDDLADFLNYQSHPEVTRFTGEAMSGQQAAEYLASQATAGDGRTAAWHAFAVEHRATASVIGDIGYWADEGPQAKADLGFQFDPRYHGQGYAFEASSALLEHLFTQLGLPLVTASCSARNEASLKLLQRLGMKQESHSEQSRSIHGELHDEVHHALLKGEWEELRK